MQKTVLKRPINLLFLVFLMRSFGSFFIGRVSGYSLQVLARLAAFTGLRGLRSSASSVQFMQPQPHNKLSITIQRRVGRWFLGF
jgi:hypothetical protein